MIGDDFDIITNLEPTNQNIDPLHDQKIHISVKQRGRKRLTYISCLPESFNFKQVCAEMKKQFSCTGSVKQKTDPEKGIKLTTIQLTGDQRCNAREFLVFTKIADSNNIQIHGY